ncbi:MAG: hypothetical protein LBG74_02990 [Spirochaetaceae bacterium]|jgi:hypothetical protein|nr:hypothetical protein [Spirochaetaceae bacterium]
MRCKTAVFLLLPMLFAVAQAAIPVKAAAQEIKFTEMAQPFEMPSSRAYGGGGYHAAFADDLSALFANPAALSSIPGQISIAELTLSACGLSMVEMFADYFFQTGDKTYLTELQQSQKNAIDLGGPLGLALAYKGFGFGAYNVVRSNITWTDETIRRPRPEFSTEFIILAGYGLTMFDTGTARGEIGLSLKFLYRTIQASLASLQGVQYFIETLNDHMMETQIGFGADAGMRFEFGTFSVGLVIHDPYSPIFADHYKNKKSYENGTVLESATLTVQPRLAMGIAWCPPPPFWRHINTDFTLTRDYRDILSVLDATARDPLLELSAGFEVTLKKTFSFRAGFFEMLPAAGLGINFGLFKLDASIFMLESGLVVWEAPSLAFSISFLWRYPFPPVRDE